MAQFDGQFKKMSGSLGQLTFRRVGTKTYVSEKVTSTTNTRTSAQQKHRMKWPNLIITGKWVCKFLRGAFEDKPEGSSDYNMFVKTNFAASKVYLTKSEVGAKACVAAPYQITTGTLESIVLTGEAGASVTDITLGRLDITADTTVRVFSNAVVTNNVDYNYGDQISFIWVEQLVDPITGYPRCKFHGEYVVLDKTSEVTLRSLVSETGFSVMSGNLACSLGDGFQGAYAWVHSRKGGGRTLVSSQVLVVKNTLYDEYSTEEAYQRAVATYGGESDSFLTTEDQQVPNLRRGGDV